MATLVRDWSIIRYMRQFYSDDLLAIAQIYPILMDVEDEGFSHDRLVESLRNFSPSEDMKEIFEILTTLYPSGLLTPNIPEHADRTFFVLNGKHFEKPDDIFYLKSQDLDRQALIPDEEVIEIGDLIIGDNLKSPIIVLYGCPRTNPEFIDVHRSLYLEAKLTKKLRYVWRENCPLPALSHVELDKQIPFSVTVPPGHTFDTELINKNLNINRSLLWGPDFTSYINWKENEENMKIISDLDMKVTSMISEFSTKAKDFEATIEYAKNLINNFPAYFGHLINEVVLEEKSKDRILRDTSTMKKLGFDYNMLGLYLNGQYLKLTEVNIYSLFHAITKEDSRIRKLHNLCKKIIRKPSYNDAKSLLSTYSHVAFHNLQLQQSLKIDLHRLSDFSESIIYFNDLEADPQYSALSSNTSVFLDKSKFGELPELKVNWNEVIFAIDFDKIHTEEDTAQALMSLKRTLVITDQGYPQRIGLLPFSGTGKSDNVLKKIYSLKRDDLLKLSEFLDTLQESKPNFEADFNIHLPNINTLLRELEITTTSIIINGEIFEFRKNTWHYLLAKVIKKDTTFLRNELIRRKAKNLDISNVNVRGLLHLKSFDRRDSKYLPNFFSDATYSQSNNDVLKKIGERVIEYIPDDTYNILHTVTLVDDYDSGISLRRMTTLLKSGTSGVRLRFVHVGDIHSSNFAKLEKIMRLPNRIQMIQELPVGTETIIEKSSCKNQTIYSHLKKWLPDISTESLIAGSFMTVNGRYIFMDEYEVPSADVLEQLYRREAQRTLDLILALEEKYPNFSTKKINPDLIEDMSALLTKLYYHGSTIYENGIEYTTEGSFPRLDLSPFSNAVQYCYFEKSSTKESTVELVLLLDPLEERTQHLISTVSLLKHLRMVNVRVYLVPTGDLGILPMHRLYVDTPSDYQEDFAQELPRSFEVQYEYPPNYVIGRNFELEGIKVQLHAFLENVPISQGHIDGEGGVCLALFDIDDKHVCDRTITMSTFGYGQLTAPSLGTNYKISSCDPDYEVVSFSENARIDYVPQNSFLLTSMMPLKLRVKLRKNSERIIDEVESPSHETKLLNVFTILSPNDASEDTYMAMIEKIMAKYWGKRRLKFWVNENPYYSHRFRLFCEMINMISKDSGTHMIEFIKLDWPSWMRPQRFFSRRVKISKIILLDIIFPQAVDDIIYMENTDKPIDPVLLFDGITISAPFHLFEIQGDGYWNEGYWAKKLVENNLSFHSLQPAFIANLKRIRKEKLGDRLRIHYQRISSDFRSLTIIDQDFINDVQQEIKIVPLPRDSRKMLVVTPDEVQKFKTQMSIDLGKLGETDLFSDGAATIHKSSRVTASQKNYFNDEL